MLTMDDINNTSDEELNQLNYAFINNDHDNNDDIYHMDEDNSDYHLNDSDIDDERNRAFRFIGNVQNDYDDIDNDLEDDQEHDQEEVLNYY